jgi:hypothetical protein
MYVYDDKKEQFGGYDEYDIFMLTREESDFSEAETNNQAEEKEKASNDFNAKDCDKPF